MTQIRNRSEIVESIAQETAKTKRGLPNFFNTQNDEITLGRGLLLSILVHGAFIVLMVALNALGIIVPAPKVELPKQDIEFKLVQNEEQPPINKNTKIRSDRNSRAGGKHDPKRAVSEPSPKSNAPAKKAVAQAPSKVPAKKAPSPAPAPKQVQPKVQPKVQLAPQPKVAQAPAKPTSVKAPTAAKPTLKPAIAPVGVAKPTAPKIATAPKSPFTVTAPKTTAPVGTTYRPQGAPGGGSSGGTAKGTGTGAPAPTFSSKGGTGTGSGSGRGTGTSGGGNYASRGTGGGYGTGGNPSPGNPNGRPGIDAIKQPNWGPYMKDLEARIKRNWSPPKGDNSRRVVIVFSIGRDGRLLSHKITKSSGVPLADQAAMKAIELTAPFRPLPPEYKGQSVPIEFTFDYNVLNSVIR